MICLSEVSGTYLARRDRPRGRHANIEARATRLPRGLRSRRGADERDVLERATRRVTRQAANADAIVDEAVAAGLDGSDPLMVHVKQLRAELLFGEGRSRARTLTQLV